MSSEKPMMREENGRFDGKTYWAVARRMVEHFDEAAYNLATKKADERGLKGVFRRLSIAYNTYRIRKDHKLSFSAGSAIRAGYGRKETPQELLEKLAYPAKRL